MARVVGGADPARPERMRLHAHHTIDPKTGDEIEIERTNSDEHCFGVERNELGSREQPTANFGCPRCDRELNPGPWRSWICWACDNIVYVGGGSR